MRAGDIGGFDPNWGSAKRWLLRIAGTFFIFLVGFFVSNFILIFVVPHPYRLFGAWIAGIYCAYRWGRGNKKFIDALPDKR